MRNQFLLIFADDCREGRFLFEANSLAEAVAMGYENEQVHVQGINHCFEVNGVYPLKDKDQVKFCIMQWTKAGPKPFKIANYSDNSYIQDLYTPCVYLLEEMFKNGLMDDEDSLTVDVMPLVIESDDRIVHAETGIAFDLCVDDFNVNK
jgi:hypothetical protein